MLARFVRTKKAGLALPSALVVAALLAVTMGALALADEGTAPVPAGEAERLGGGAQQQVALGDGSVTQAEYAAAFQLTLTCLSDAGIPYVVSSDSQGNPRYSAGPFASKADLDAAKPSLDGCYVEHLRGIDVARAAASR